MSIRACLCSQPAWRRRFQISAGKLILVEGGSDCAAPLPTVSALPVSLTHRTLNQGPASAICSVTHRVIVRFWTCLLSGSEGKAQTAGRISIR